MSLDNGLTPDPSKLAHTNATGKECAIPIAMAMDGFDEEEGEEEQRRPHSRLSGSRRTRSQAAPDWTPQESLTLVNEIAAVEGDCRKTLSSFQKWKIIVQNCNALDVNRALSQCRRQWDSLLADYKKIKHWDSTSSESSRLGSYWALDRERRRELGLPEDFDLEVFNAIDDHLKEEDRSDTDPDIDPEALDDGVDVVPPSGFKKQGWQVMRQKRSIRQRVKPQSRCMDKKIMPEQSSLEGKAMPPKHGKGKKVMLEQGSIEDKEQMVTAKLRENAELIIAMVEGNLNDESEDCVLADLKNVEASRTDFTRRQGDKLITCLGNIADSLDQLCDLVQECGQFSTR